nr:glycoside hydrolase family 3 N-terminal domain-containing protein [Oceanicoccus sp. KOV_DT_Chl]
MKGKCLYWIPALFKIGVGVLVSFKPLIAMCELDMAVEQKIDALLASMTVDEKIGQLAMRGTSSREKGSLSEQLKAAVRSGHIGTFLNVMEVDHVDELQRLAVEESRLGIPLVFSRDVIHGFKTIFPIPLGLAASWNPEQAKLAARTSAKEASEFGIRWTFAPMMDIARDPRWGRIAESFGEDPFLASQFSVAMVEGFQTDDLTRADSMAATAKHLVGYGAAEGGRDYNIAMISEWELRDVYLKPFKAASDAGVASMMTSFNELNGVPATGNKFVLQEILRQQWQYAGVVVSDWESVTEMIAHGFAEDSSHAAQLALSAGLDIEMTSKAYQQHLATLLAAGKLRQTELDSAVRNVLRMKFRLGLFDQPYRVTASESSILNEMHLSRAKDAALESAVLLKNSNRILPLNKHQQIAIIGPMANAPHEQMGTWVFDGRAVNSQVPLAAIKSIVGDSQVHYAAGLGYSRDVDDAGFSAALAAANQSDVIVFFAGEEAILSGEAHSRADIDLPGAQQDLLLRLSTLGKPIVLVLMAGRPNTLSTIIDKVDAVLVSFYAGLWQVRQSRSYY